MIVTGPEPVLRRCDAGMSVTLVAPASIVDRGQVLAFSHWEVDGTAGEMGQTAVSVRVADERAAVAVYSPTRE